MNDVAVEPKKTYLTANFIDLLPIFKTPLQGEISNSKPARKPEKTTESHNLALIPIEAQQWSKLHTAFVPYQFDLSEIP